VQQQATPATTPQAAAQQPVATATAPAAPAAPAAAPAVVPAAPPAAQAQPQPQAQAVTSSAAPAAAAAEPAPVAASAAGAPAAAASSEATAAAAPTTPAAAITESTPAPVSSSSKSAARLSQSSSSSGVLEICLGLLFFAVLLAGGSVLRSWQLSSEARTLKNRVDGWTRSKAQRPSYRQSMCGADSTAGENHHSSGGEPPLSDASSGPQPRQGRGANSQRSRTVEATHSDGSGGEPSGAGDTGASSLSHQARRLAEQHRERTRRPKAAEAY